LQAVGRFANNSATYSKLSAQLKFTRQPMAGFDGARLYVITNLLDDVIHQRVPLLE
jgi:hypothetical protein